jgi:hypothetical protein
MKIRSLMAARIIAYYRKPSRMIQSSNRDEKNLPVSTKLKHDLWALKLNRHPAAVKQNSPKTPASNPGAKA